jgi:hypothetical protein
MANGKILQDYGNGHYKVRIDVKADERQDTIDALTAEIAERESDVADLDTDINTAISELEQAKSVYYTKTNELLTCFAANPLEPLLCKQQQEAADDAAADVVRAGSKLAALRRERSILKGRIKEATDALDDWTNNILTYKELDVWSMDYPEDFVAIPGPAEDVTVVPIQGLKKSTNGDYYIPIVEYVLHWLTYNYGTTEDRPGLGDEYDNKPAAFTKEYQALRDKQWTAMSAIQNITLAQRQPNIWDGKWLVGTVQAVGITFLTVRLDGTTRGGDAEPSFNAGWDVNASVQYYPNDIARVYRVGDRVAVLASGPTSFSVIGFVENPRKGCRWPAVNVSLRKTLKNVYGFDRATGNGPGDCFVASVSNWGNWYTDQVNGTPATDGYSEYEIINPVEPVFDGTAIVGDISKQINYSSQSVWVRDWKFIWWTGCTGFTPSGWYLQEEANHASYTYTNKPAMADGFKEWLHPVYVRNKHTGEVAFYDRILREAFNGQLNNAHEFLFVPGIGSCVPSLYENTYTMATL